MHFDTGLLWVDVEDDFNRARRRQVLARLAGWLRGQPRHVSRILLLDEVVAALGWRGERYLGLQAIPLDTVAGTVDSRRDFDRKFRPTSNRVRQRWERLETRLMVPGDRLEPTRRDAFLLAHARCSDVKRSADSRISFACFDRAGRWVAVFAGREQGTKDFVTILQGVLPMSTGTP